LRRSVIIAEDFYGDPFSVVGYALRQKFYYPYEPDADVESGKTPFSWMSTRFKPSHECPFKSSRALVGKLEHLTGDKIDMEHWRMGFPVTAEGKAAPDCHEAARTCLWNCCFHFKPDTGQEIGQGVHNHLTDRWNGVGENGWAGLIYLSRNAPLSGGLRLWRNRDPRKNFDWMTPAENWELVDALGNVFNRLILCRGNLPHSGANGWGREIESGRLYQTFFFKVKDPAVTESLRLSL
jgi:hypothetical protein